MNTICTFTLDGQDIDLMLYKNELGYAMNVNGQPYGLKVKLKSRKVIDIASATFQLLQNALESKNKLNENN